MNQFVLIKDADGQWRLYERVEDPVFQRISHNPVVCEQIRATRPGRTMSAAVLALLLWVAKDSASIAWHWVLAVMMNVAS